MENGGHTPNSSGLDAASKLESTYKMMQNDIAEVRRIVQESGLTSSGKIESMRKDLERRAASGQLLQGGDSPSTASRREEIRKRLEKMNIGSDSVPPSPLFGSTQAVPQAQPSDPSPQPERDRLEALRAMLEEKRRQANLANSNPTIPASQSQQSQSFPPHQDEPAEVDLDAEAEADFLDHIEREMNGSGLQILDDIDDPFYGGEADDEEVGAGLHAYSRPLNPDDAASSVGGGPTGAGAENANLSVHERLYLESLKIRAEREAWREREQERQDRELRASMPVSSSKRAGGGRKSSSGSGPVPRIEEELLRKSEESKARIEELRRQKELAELAELRSPQISRLSQTLQRNEPAFQRLYEARRATQEKKEILREQMTRKELEEVRAAPQINPQSHRMERSIDSILAWDSVKKEKIARLKQQRDLEEKQQVLTKPIIDPNSARLAKATAKTTAPGAHKVEDRLMAKHAAMLAKRESERRAAEAQIAGESSPMISVHSAQLQRNRDGPTSERLYQLAQILQEKKRAKIQQQHLMESGVPVIGGGGVGSSSRVSDAGSGSGSGGEDPNTGQRLYKPFINPRSSALVRTQPVEEILLQKGSQAEEKKKKVAEQKEHELKQGTAVKVGPYSQLLVEILEKRTQQKTSERLTQPTRTFKLKTLEHLEAEEQNCTFRPNINTTSRVIDQELNGGPLDRAKALLRKGEEYQEKKALLKKEALERELSECTFAPQRPASPRSGASSPVHDQRPLTPISSRSAEWLRKREEHLQVQRVQAEMQEVMECTFAPRLDWHDETSPKNMLSSRNGRSTTPPPSMRRSTSQSSLNSQPRRSSTPTNSQRFNTTSSDFQPIGGGAFLNSPDRGESQVGEEGETNISDAIQRERQRLKSMQSSQRNGQITGAAEPSAPTTPTGQWLRQFVATSPSSSPPKAAW